MTFSQVIPLYTKELTGTFVELIKEFYQVVGYKTGIQINYIPAYQQQ